MLPGICQAAEYYVSPAGSDSNNGTSCLSAKKTISAGISLMFPGDALLFCDGTYDWDERASDSGVFIVSGLNGNPSNYYSFKAVNDGKAIIDGQEARYACWIYKSSYINMEGFLCKNSYDGAGLYISGSSSYINVRKVSAKGGPIKQEMGFSVSGGSNHILLEDTFAYGWGRTIYNIINSSYVTLRRAFALYDNYNLDSQPSSPISIYGSSNCIVENSVSTKTSASSRCVAGPHVWYHTYNTHADNNKFLGNVTYNLSCQTYAITSARKTHSGNQFINNVAVDNIYGVGINGDTNSLWQNNTIADWTTLQAFNIQENSYCKDSNFDIYAVIKNNSIINGPTGFWRKTSKLTRYDTLVDLDGDFYYETSVPGECTNASVPDEYSSISNLYNNIYGVTTCFLTGTSAGTGDMCNTINPNYNTNTYGKGAYLMVPPALKGKGENSGDIGAEVLYKYVNGVKTSEPLWPWPMEDRIKAETGISVTYEANGGIWKTLDGVYSDTSPPAAPTGLTIN